MVARRLAERRVFAGVLTIVFGTGVRAFAEPSRPAAARPYSLVEDARRIDDPGSVGSLPDLQPGEQRDVYGSGAVPHGCEFRTELRHCNLVRYKYNMRVEFLDRWLEQEARFYKDSGVPALVEQAIDRLLKFVDEEFAKVNGLLDQATSEKLLGSVVAALAANEPDNATKLLKDGLVALVPGEWSGVAKVFADAFFEKLVAGVMAVAAADVNRLRESLRAQWPTVIKAALVDWLDEWLPWSGVSAEALDAQNDNVDRRRLLAAEDLAAVQDAVRAARLIDDLAAVEAYNGKLAAHEAPEADAAANNAVRGLMERLLPGQYQADSGTEVWSPEAAIESARELFGRAELVLSCDANTGLTEGGVGMLTPPSLQTATVAEELTAALAGGLAAAGDTVRLSDETLAATHGQARGEAVNITFERELRPPSDELVAAAAALGERLMADDPAGAQVISTHRFGVTGHWRVDFSEGVVATGIVDRDYTTSVGGVIQRTSSSSVSFDESVLMHYTYRVQPSLGLGASLGVSGFADLENPRVLVGGALAWNPHRGDFRVILSGGAAFGTQQRLAAGNLEGSAPTADPVPTRRQFDVDWWVGFTFNALDRLLGKLLD